MKRNFKMTLFSLGLISTLFMGCGPNADKVINEVFEKAKIWNNQSEKITIEQYTGVTQSDTHRVEIYQNSRESLTSSTLELLNKTYAWENLQGMTCPKDAITYSIVIRDKNNSLSQFYSANIHCDNTKGKKFIPVISIEKLIEILED